MPLQPEPEISPIDEFARFYSKHTAQNLAELCDLNKNDAESVKEALEAFFFYLATSYARSSAVTITPGRRLQDAAQAAASEMAAKAAQEKAGVDDFLAKHRGSTKPGPGRDA